MKPSISLSLVVCIGLAACSTNDSATKSRSIGGPGAASADATFDGAPLSNADYDMYGEAVHEGAATPVSEVIANPASFAAKPVRITGPILAVCPTKGCWVKIGTPESNILVDMQEAGFVLPTDADGIVICEGGLTADAPAVGEIGDATANVVKFKPVGVAIAKK